MVVIALMWMSCFDVDVIAGDLYGMVDFYSYFLLLMCLLSLLLSLKGFTFVTVIIFFTIISIIMFLIITIVI